MFKNFSSDVSWCLTLTTSFSYLRLFLLFLMLFIFKNFGRVVYISNICYNLFDMRVSVPVGIHWRVYWMPSEEIHKHFCFSALWRIFLVDVEIWTYFWNIAWLQAQLLNKQRIFFFYKSVIFELLYSHK